jgi:hypothetical protein
LRGFICLKKHLLQRTETAFDMTKRSEAELRSNVQAAIAQSDIDDFVQKEGMIMENDNLLRLFC